MTAETNESTATGDGGEATRERVRTVLAKEGLTQADLAREFGIAYGTFTAWFGGHYKGKNDRIEAEVVNGLDAREAKKHALALAPKVPGFVVTPAAEAFFNILEHAQVTPDFCIVTGAPGVGKTSAACAYKRRKPNVTKIVGHPMMASPRAMLEELGRELGMLEMGASYKMMSAITRRLRGVGALVIVDEAQHLESVALDQLRSIHDAAECGVVLLGNTTVLGRLEGGARSAQFAQLHSRVGMRYARPRALKEDIDTLIDAWGVNGPAERKLLHVIARKPGALRSMTKALRHAHMLAAAEKAPLAERHIHAAYARLGNGGEPI